MELSQKNYTVESVAELIRQDPDKAFEFARTLPGEEIRALMGALPSDEADELHARAYVAAFNAHLEAGGDISPPWDYFGDDDEDKAGQARS